MKKNKILIGALALSLLPKLSYAAGDIKIYIDDKEIKSDVSAVIEDGRTLVPLRMISEGLGADVNWEGATRGVEISKNNKEPLWIYCDSNIAKVNNNKIMYLEKAPKIINDRTFVPLRFIAESFDLVDKDNYKTAVLWDEGTRSVKIYSDINNTNMSEEDVFLSQLEKIQNILINMSKGLATENNEIEKTNIINKNKERIEKISSEIVVPEKHKVKYTEYKNILNQINPSNINISELNKTYEIISGKEIKSPKKAENKQIVNTKDIDVNAVKFIKNGKDITSPKKVIDYNGKTMIPVDFLAKLFNRNLEYEVSADKKFAYLLLEGETFLDGFVYLENVKEMAIHNFWYAIESEPKIINKVMYVPLSSINDGYNYGFFIKNNVVKIYDLNKDNGKINNLLTLQVMVKYFDIYVLENNLFRDTFYETDGPMHSDAIYDDEYIDVMVDPIFKDNRDVVQKVDAFNKLGREITVKYYNAEKEVMDSDGRELEKMFPIFDSVLKDIENLEKIYDEIVEIYVQNGYI